MGINAAFSSWLQGAQSFATTTLRTAQGYGAALQQQTMTAVSAAQRAATQPFQQAIQPRPSTRPTSSSPHTARTLTPVDAVTRAVSSGVRGVQEAAGQIVRAHAPIVQGVQRDIGRATQALPQAARSAPAAIQQGATQIARAHSPIVQGVQRDAGSAIRSVSGANPLRQPAPRVVSSPTPTGTPQARVQQFPGTPIPTQRTAAAYDQMSQRHEAAVRQYNINPDIQQYQQKLSAYNAQLAAHERAMSLGRGRQETAARLQSMYGELEGMRSSIDSRKRQELAEIRMMEANLRMLGLPLQAESARLQAESARLRMDSTLQRTRGKGSPAPTSRAASPTDGALAAARNYPFNAPAFQVAGWIGSAAASALKGGLVLPTETEARYRDHMTANEEYQALRKQYGGNFEGNTFVARNAQDMAAYGRLQSAAVAVEKTGQAYETASQRELFGVPAAARGVGDWFSEQDRNISSTALRYVPQLAAAPEAVGNLRTLSTWMSPGTQALEVGGRLTRRAIGKSAEEMPTAGESFRAMSEGVAEGWVYQPMTSAAWFGVGGALGGGIGAAGRAAKPVTKALAPLAKATGISRLLAPAKPFVTRGTDLVWKGVGAAYAADVGYRSVIDENGNIRPPLQQARELGRISATEALPMGVGAAAISRAPALARSAAAAPQRMMSSFRGRSAPPADVMGGWYPGNEAIMDGFRLRSLSPSSSAKVVHSSRYPKSRVEMVDVGGGRRVPNGELDNYLRRFEIETPQWRKPIPEDYLAAEDIAQAYKFGGRGGITLPGDPVPTMKGGWYPENWQIMEGLRMREMSSPIQVARGSSRYPSSRVEMIDVGGGRRIPKGELDSYLRRFEIETPQWRKPVPEEHLAAEDVAEAYKFGSRGDPLLDRVPPEYRAKWGGDAPEAFYAGAPMGRSRQVPRPRQRSPTRPAPGSSSGRTPRIRPTTRTVPVEPSSGQASPLVHGGWGDSALGEVAVTALAPAQVVSPITDSLSVIGPRNTSILDLGLGSSVLSRSGLDLLGRQGVVSVQAQEQGQRQAVLLASDLLQGMMQSPRLRQGQRQKQKQRSRYARPRLPTAPKAKARPRARARKSDEEEAERRRRLREAQDRAHWEIGPGPGISEMSSMIFGTSVLNLGAAPRAGAPAPSFGFTTRPPAPPVIPAFGPPAKATGKKPAHAGQSEKKKRGKATKKKK